ncbi:uncharacterized protein LOC111398317 [Olea europaea var. sylvestris]|uniref:uncharacterized protein LOC111398317 n=1 Tax=Olea europaea var. sylvestris TaxID=158386 RepID=UPI000C1D5DFB|nr:uncharacterized protein LOC111398317 [Olea europaea var. sylvestris]
MPSYAKFMKEILTNKRKLEDLGTMMLNEEYSAILQNKLPPKLKDSGCFTILYIIGYMKFDKVLYDLVGRQVYKFPRRITEDILVIAALDWDLPFELMCDTGDYVVGIGLVIVFAFDKLRSYLMEQKVIVYTDHAALKYLMTEKNVKPRLIRWILFIQKFDFEIWDKKKSENMLAYCLLRLE